MLRWLFRKGNAFSIMEAVVKLSLVCLFLFNRTGSNPKIRRNKIWGGQNGGILVYNSGEKQKSIFCFIILEFNTTVLAVNNET